MADASRWTIGRLKQLATARLRAADVDDAAGEARRLVAVATGVDPIDLVARPELPADDRAAAEVERLVARREHNEPLSRILGEREFYGRLFRLSPGTLDPRPDTEVLFQAVLDLTVDRMRPVRLLDIGTGTGIVAITLLAEMANATAVAVDLSEDALTTAADNARCHGVADRLRLERRDLFQSDWVAQHGQFDFIVSNPPYIPSREIATLEPEVRLFDPHLALDGGADGLDAYRALQRYLQALVPGGWMAVEVGAGQCGEVGRLLGGGSGVKRIFSDLGGHQRVVAVQPRSGDGDILGLAAANERANVK